VVLVSPATARAVAAYPAGATLPPARGLGVRLARAAERRAARRDGTVPLVVDSLERGVAATTRLAVGPELEGVTGVFYDREHQASPNPCATDPEAQLRPPVEDGLRVGLEPPVARRTLPGLAGPHLVGPVARFRTRADERGPVRAGNEAGPSSRPGCLRVVTEASGTGSRDDKGRARARLPVSSARVWCAWASHAGWPGPLRHDSLSGLLSTVPKPNWSYSTVV
jgi:hypothetical protein